MIFIIDFQGLYPKSLGICELTEEQSIDDNVSENSGVNLFLTKGNDISEENSTEQTEFLRRHGFNKTFVSRRKRIEFAEQSSTRSNNPSRFEFTSKLSFNNTEFSLESERRRRSKKQNQLEKFTFRKSFLSFPVAFFHSGKRQHDHGLHRQFE